MATLIPKGEEVECSQCSVIFQVIWHRNGWTEGISFCPFCGDEIEAENRNE